MTTQFIPFPGSKDFKVPERSQEDQRQDPEEPLDNESDNGASTDPEQQRRRSGDPEAGIHQPERQPENANLNRK